MRKATSISVVGEGWPAGLDVGSLGLDELEANARVRHGLRRRRTAGAKGVSGDGEPHLAQPDQGPDCAHRSGTYQLSFRSQTTGPESAGRSGADRSSGNDSRVAPAIDRQEV